MLRHKNKRTWIIGISILSVALIISSSFSIAAENASQSEQTVIGDTTNPEDSLLALNIEGDNAPDVDIELEANENGILDAEVFVDAVELNVLGRATLEVVSGGENLARAPIFAGLDKADNIFLSIIAISAISIATIAKIVKQYTVLGLYAGVVIGTAVAGGILTAFAAAVAAGSLALFLSFLAGGTIFSILDGHGLSESAINAVMGFLEGVKQTLIGFWNMIEPLVVNFDIVEAMLYIKDMLVALGQAIVDIATTSLVGVAAIIMALKYIKEGPDWTEIKETLMAVGYSSYQATQLVNKIQNAYGEIMDFRDSVIGAIDFFVTMGETHKPIRNLYAVIDTNYQGGDDEYVAILKVKAFSAEAEFDEQTIGIKFDGFNSIPGEPVGSEPVGSEPVGSEPVGSEPVGSETTQEETLGGAPAAGGVITR